jgi:hypothetical protein
MARPRDRRESFLDVLWLLFFGALSAEWCVTAAQALSATFDEPTYLRLGLEHWRSGSSRALMKLGTMPLAADLQALPLFVWEKWRGLPVDPARDIAWILPWARAVTLAFWWTLLFYAWRSGRALSGPWAGRLAVAIIAAEPIFLAHASLATSDIAVTACLLAFFFEFRAQRDRSWPLRVALPALLYGIAVLMKASALAFGVVGMFAIEVERLFASGRFQDWRQHLAAVRPFLRDVVGVVAGGLVVTFVYCGSSNAGEGLAEQIRHNLHGHGAYLLGREYRRAIWFYFPVALTIKTSLPLLLLPLVVAWIQRSALWNWACLVAFALLLFSLSSRVQIGVRLMLPLLACLAVGVAAAIVHVVRSSGERSRTVLIALVGVCLVGNGVAAARVWPEALCYTNAVWGGTRTGYRLLSDSNYDWGQGLLELEQWRKEHGVETIDVWYFGVDPRAQVPPFRLLPMHSREWLGDRSPALAADDKIVAVGTTLLFGAYAKRAEPGRGAVAFFLAQEPIDRTSTFFIYDLRREKREMKKEARRLADEFRQSARSSRRGSS